MNGDMGNRPMSIHRTWDRSTRSGALLVALLLAVSGLVSVGVLFAHTTAAPGPVAGPARLAPAVAPANSATFNPPCYKIDQTVCISIQNQNETDIIPPTGSFVSTQEPNCTSDEVLVIKSHSPLNWTSNPKYGPDSPIALNVTGVLWNGDLFYSPYDGTIWHSDQATNWWTQLAYVPQNLTYPWQYSVTMSAKSSSGAPNFYPGMTVQWWIYLTYNVSVNATLTYIHHLSPTFQFTCSGAWPFSPYPGSFQYAGTSAAYEDLSVTATPRDPNFNDSVKVVVNTTQADLLSNATIGANSYLDLNETNINGTVVATATFPLPVTITNGFGAVSVSVLIPAMYAQVQGATVTYVLTVRDVANDLLVTPPATYVVGGNGTFLSGTFTDDLNLGSSPSTVVANLGGTASLNPGQPLNLTLFSRNPATAISAAEAVYTVSYPLLHETVTLTAHFARQTSVEFTGVIPGLPLASFVNFTILAWDATERLEVSPVFGYLVPDLQTVVPEIPTNSSFIYVFVYDNGTHTWVSGAHVQIEGFGGVYNTYSNTSLGVAYPNQTSGGLVPLLIAANGSYKITVDDPWFVPTGERSSTPVNVTVLVLHSMTARQTLLAGSDFSVVQEGNSIVFWLNATPPPLPVSPTASPGGAVPLAAVLGLVGALIAAIPLVFWWRQIRARRKEEEKRVTL